MKPYIVCHMVMSVDGRIDCDMVDKISGEEYYTVLNSFDCQAKIEGKYSYQLHHCGFKEFDNGNSYALGKEEVYVAAKCEGYEVSLDTNGRLLWDKGYDNHICILSEKTTLKYLDYLKSKSISYIVTGKDKIDLPRAMEQLYKYFKVKRVALVGGGKINAAFLSDDLIDELSVMIAPGIDGRMYQPALFDYNPDYKCEVPLRLIFKSSKVFPNGVIWIKYKLHNKD